LRYLFEDYVLDTGRRELHRGGHAVPLAPQVFDLIDYLIRNRERVVSRDDLIAAVWGGRIVSDAAVTTRINAARSAVGDSGEEQRLIKTLPRKGFRFVGAVREEQAPARAASADSPLAPPAPSLALPDKPSIAVLPFTNLSGDPGQDYFIDGIVEDIITELSRFSELFVIARNSSFKYKGKATDVRDVGRELGVRYVLEGSVRRGGDRIRIGAQLVEAATGVHCWAERYDRKLEDVFGVQDEVVGTIVAILAAHVRRAETERSRAKPPNSLRAYDCCLQAADAMDSFLSTFKVENVYEARRLAQQSVAIDEDYSRAYTILAVTYATVWIHPLDGDFRNPTALDQAHDLARKAIQLDRNLPQAHAELGFVLILKNQHDASIAAFEKAMALNPNYVDWRFGFALIYGGESQRALDVVHAYMRLDPFCVPTASLVLGFAHYMLEQYAQALPLLRDYVAQVPTDRYGHRVLTATFAHLGQLEEARAAAADLLRVQPRFTIATARISWFKHAKDARQIHDGLRRAGLPE
jgi:TolB-like protein/Tfp pilus assembly protein PilF